MMLKFKKIMKPCYRLISISDMKCLKKKAYEKSIYFISI